MKWIKRRKMSKLYGDFRPFVNKVLKYLNSQEKEWLVNRVMEGCALVTNIFDYLDKLALSRDFVSSLDENSVSGTADLAELSNLLKSMMDIPDGCDG